MGQRDYNQCVGTEVMYLKCQRSIGDHYSDNMQATYMLLSVAFLLLLEKRLVKDQSCI